MHNHLRPRLRLLEQRSALPPAKVTDSFYLSPAWRDLMAEIVAERGRRCEDPACTRSAPPSRVFGDHIVELRDGGAPLDKRNVLLRCGACHTRKTASARAARTAARPLPAAAGSDLHKFGDAIDHRRVEMQPLRVE